MAEMGRKHCGKRRNCSLRAIPPFPTVFKRLLLQTRKNQGLFGKELKKESHISLFGFERVNDFPNKPWFSHVCSTSLENTVGKGVIALNEQFLLFPQCFLLF